LSKASDASAVRADPYYIIAHAPHILFETVVTDLEATWTIPAERQFSAADVAAIILMFAPTIAFGAGSRFFFSFGVRN